MSVFPDTIDSFTNPVGTNTLDDPDHALQHSDANDAIEAIEAVIGTTAGTSVLKDFSAGEFAVRQEGGTVSPGTLTFDSPVINDAILGSPTLTGGTINATTLGTPTITGGSFASPTTTGTDAGTATLTNKTLTSPLYQGLIDGWVSANETWEYVSVDDPTGIFRVNADVTGKYSAGMRIKFTNATNVIYGIVTVVGSYSGGYTSITFLHQIDPTDNLALVLMADSAITANYYSTQKAPQGFPLDPSKWSVELIDTSNRTEAGASGSTWYNIGSLSLAVPIGCFEIYYQAIVVADRTSSGALNMVQTTLSTANNSESDANMTIGSGINGDANSASWFVWASHNKSRLYTLTSKATYYLNLLSPVSSNLELRGDVGSTIIRATCAYL